MELLSTSCTVHNNQGFTINISERKCGLITLETACKKSGISKMECTTELHIQQLPQTLVRNPLHSPTSTEDWIVLYSHYLNCVNEHVAQK